MRRILVTHALPYANAALHFGHMLESTQTDIWVRYQRLRGHDCRFVCAHEVHGTPIMLMAEKRGMSPEQLVEEVGSNSARTTPSSSSATTISTPRTATKTASWQA